MNFSDLPEEAQRAAIRAIGQYGQQEIRRKLSDPTFKGAPRVALLAELAAYATHALQLSIEIFYAKDATDADREAVVEMIRAVDRGKLQERIDILQGEINDPEFFRRLYSILDRAGVPVDLEFTDGD